MIEFVIITVLILLNGLFVAAEFAIVGAPRAAIDARAARGDKLAAAVQRVLSDAWRQDRYIATAQLGITVASLGLGMFGEHVLAEAIYEGLGGAGVPAWIASHGAASVAAVAVLTYFHIVIGEMVPKSLALQQAERLAVWVTPLMRSLTLVVLPLVVVLNGIANQMLRLAGIRREISDAERYYTAEELQLVVQETQEHGGLRREAGEVLQELFEFGELTAAEAMIPRVRVSAIPLSTTPAALRSLVSENPHTRYVVVDGDLDHVVGHVHIKDVLRALLRGTVIDASMARPTPVVPEVALLDSVLAVMRAERAQLVVVVDEHGGTAGIVTLEDLFEEVVGEIEDNPDAKPALWRDGEGRLRVPGTLRVTELGAAFDLDLEHDDVDSVSGLVLALLGRPPAVGDRVGYDRLILEVTATRGRGVEECAVTLEATAPPRHRGQSPH